MVTGRIIIYTNGWFRKMCRTCETIEKILSDYDGDMIPHYDTIPASDIVLMLLWKLPPTCKKCKEAISSVSTHSELLKKKGSRQYECINILKDIMWKKTT
jgi:hypothetical protein